MEWKAIFNYRLSTTLWPLKQLGFKQNSLDEISLIKKHGATNLITFWCFKNL